MTFTKIMLFYTYRTKKLSNKSNEKKIPPHGNDLEVEMTYMQIKGGQKLHLVYAAGEGRDEQHLIRAGYFSHPICGRTPDNEKYRNGFRMTINVPLANACKNCLRVHSARN